MPMLLAKYNISFLDAIGRPPRILPYEYFRSNGIWCLTSSSLQIGANRTLPGFTGIQHEFKDLPGATWVDRPRYLVLSLTNNQTLDECNWNVSVAPGTTVAMSMVVEKLIDASSLTESRCPESGCQGTWPKSETRL